MNVNTGINIKKLINLSIQVIQEKWIMVKGKEAPASKYTYKAK